MSTGTVYLLHFSAPVGNPTNPRAMAAHYVGWTSDLAARLEQHRAGRGARLTAVAIEQGITFAVVATWPGDRTLERWIKDRKAAPRLCPICGRSHPRGRLVLPGPAQQLALPLDGDPFSVSVPPVAGVDAYELLVRRSWRQPASYPVAADADLDLPY